MTQLRPAYPHPACYWHVLSWMTMVAVKKGGLSNEWWICYESNKWDMPPNPLLNHHIRYPAFSNTPRHHRVDVVMMLLLMIMMMMMSRWWRRPWWRGYPRAAVSQTISKSSCWVLYHDNLASIFAKSQFRMAYPLVNVYITMENPPIFNGKSSFSMGKSTINHHFQ